VEQTFWRRPLEATVDDLAAAGFLLERIGETQPERRRGAGFPRSRHDRGQPTFIGYLAVPREANATWLRRSTAAPPSVRAKRSHGHLGEERRVDVGRGAGLATGRAREQDAGRNVSGRLFLTSERLLFEPTGSMAPSR